MLIEAFNKLIVGKILSDTVFLTNQNLPPVICLYFENLNSRQSVWNRDVKTYLHFFSIRRSSIRAALHRSICLLAQSKFLRVFFLCRLCQSSSQFANSRKNKGFLSSLTAALPVGKFVLNSCLLLFIVHQTLKSFKKRIIQPIWEIAFYGRRYTLIKNCWSNRYTLVIIARIHCFIRQFRCFFHIGW